MALAAGDSAIHVDSALFVAAPIVCMYVCMGSLDPCFFVVCVVF